MPASVRFLRKSGCSQLPLQCAFRRPCAALASVARRPSAWLENVCGVVGPAQRARSAALTDRSAAAAQLPDRLDCTVAMHICSTTRTSEVEPRLPISASANELALFTFICKDRRRYRRDWPLHRNASDFPAARLATLPSPASGAKVVKRVACGPGGVAVLVDDGRVRPVRPLGL